MIPKLNDGYNWTAASAAYQIAHGGPTHRSLSAINYLDAEIHQRTGELLVDIADSLLLELTDSRGLRDLESALVPMEDSEDADNLPWDNVQDALRNYGAVIVTGPTVRLRFPSYAAAAQWADDQGGSGIADRVKIIYTRSEPTLASPVEVIYQPKK